MKDDDQNIWVGSPRGFSIIDSKTGEIRDVSYLNGLPKIEILSAIKTSDGKFISRCSNGLLKFDPADFKPDTLSPLLHLDQLTYTFSESKNHRIDSIILLFGKKEVLLHYNENKISFHYTALSYQDAALNQYEYELEGYDKNWIQAGTLRNATYTNLGPGKYVFHIKSANSDGVWNETDESVIVIISPPWWQTWWAYFAYAIVFAFSVWAFIRYRISRVKRDNEILENKVSLRTEQLNQSLENLKSTQSQLIQSEKMASLGELTAGIAHEIQNPLNFVNNFSEVSNELVDEMNEELNKGDISEAKEIANDIKQNLKKINHHGKRADAIVKGMLQHSRSSTGAKEPTDINEMADEYLRLSYHGLRAKDKSFNAELKTDFDPSIGKINIIPQDIGRVLLNLYNNAFCAVNEKKEN